MRLLDKYFSQWHLAWLFLVAISAVLTADRLLDPRGPSMSPELCLVWFAAAGVSVIVAWQQHSRFLPNASASNAFNTLLALAVVVSVFYYTLLAYPPLPGEPQYDALKVAVYGNDSGEVRVLVPDDANPDYLPPDSRGPRLLVVASAYGELDIASLLIEHGASTAGVGDRLLRQAAECGDTPLIETLIQHGVPANDNQRASNSSALWKAVQHDEVAAARCLLAHGASPFTFGVAPAAGGTAWSVLHLARSRNDAAMVNLLKGAGAPE